MVLWNVEKWLLVLLCIFFSFASFCHLRLGLYWRNISTFNDKMFCLFARCSLFALCYFAFVILLAVVWQTRNHPLCESAYDCDKCLLYVVSQSIWIRTEPIYAHLSHNIGSDCLSISIVHILIHFKSKQTYMNALAKHIDIGSKDAHSIWINSKKLHIIRSHIVLQHLEKKTKQNQENTQDTFEICRVDAFIYGVRTISCRFCRLNEMDCVRWPIISITGSESSNSLILNSFYRLKSRKSQTQMSSCRLCTNIDWAQQKLRHFRIVIDNFIFEHVSNIKPNANFLLRSRRLCHRSFYVGTIWNFVCLFIFIFFFTVRTMAQLHESKKIYALCFGLAPNRYIFLSVNFCDPCCEDETGPKMYGLNMAVR